MSALAASWGDEGWPAPTYGRSSTFINLIIKHGTPFIEVHPERAMTATEIAEELNKVKGLEKVTKVEVQDHLIRVFRHGEDIRHCVTLTVAKLRKEDYILAGRRGIDRLMFVTDDPDLIELWEDRQAKEDRSRLRSRVRAAQRRLAMTTPGTVTHQRARRWLLHESRCLEDFEFECEHKNIMVLDPEVRTDVE